ncbi:MAG: restriction endonuclease subunit S, partial [Lachnospiraceae bacterium]|nr:restriction endonuclease subunit S [Lachnospiraceae bacterium]
MEYKKLGDIATYINGYAFKPEDRGEEGLPIIRIQDLTGNSYDLGFYNGEYPEKIEINDGDVLISWSASLGVYVWNRGKALLNQHIFKVAFDKLDIDKNYFVYAVRRKLDEMTSKTHGATMKHIVKKDFDATQIPYPSLEEQAKIASNLDRVSRITEARKEELVNFDELIKARFVELFG